MHFSRITIILYLLTNGISPLYLHKYPTTYSRQTFDLKPNFLANSDPNTHSNNHLILAIKPANPVNILTNYILDINKYSISFGFLLISQNTWLSRCFKKMFTKIFLYIFNDTVATRIKYKILTNACLKFGSILLPSDLSSLGKFWHISWILIINYPQFLQKMWGPKWPGHS